MDKRATVTFVQAFEGALPPTEAAPLTVPRCKILGLESRWGRKFTEAALKDAVARGIYEGLTIYKDHPTVDYSDPNWQKKTLPPRSVDDVLGSIANVIYVEGQGIFGDAVFTVDSDLTRSVCLSAKTNPRQYGFSHHAVYENVVMEGDVQVVGSIPTAFSVDLVTRPATTNGLFEGKPMSKDTKKGKTEEKPSTIRSVLEGACTLPIAKKVIQALEGDYMDAPMAVPGAEATVDDQIADAFSAAVAAVAADKGLDLKSKLSKLKDILTAQDKLMNGNEAAAAPAQEGDTPPDPAGDKKVDDKESAPGQPIGMLEALALLETNKLSIDKVALESYAAMPLEVAKFAAAREAANQKEITDLKARLSMTTNEKPKSIPRIGMEGGAPQKDAKKAKELEEKPWRVFSHN